MRQDMPRNNSGGGSSGANIYATHESNIWLTNSLCHGGGYAALHFYYSSNLHALNSTITSDLFMASPQNNITRAYCTNSIVAGDTWGYPPININSFFGNPGFIDNYQLAPGSPAIDAGNNSLWTGTPLEGDLAGAARIANGTIDMGAYEYHLPDSALPTVDTIQAYDATPVGDTQHQLDFWWQASDDTGIWKYEYRVDGGAWTETDASHVVLPVSDQQINFEVRAIDVVGQTGTACLLTIENQPVADLTANPNPAAYNQAITFDASGSHHDRPDRSIAQYEWDFGDGTSYTETAAVAPDGLFDGIATHAYGQFGSYDATLTVTDDNTPAKTDTETVIVDINLGNRAPVADADGPYRIDIGEDLLLDGSGSSDPDEGFGDSIVRYEWDIDDDGTFDYETSVSTLTVPWADLTSLPQPGVANEVSLRVTDTFGITDSDTSSLTIYENQPVADLAANPNPAACNQAISFDASGSYHDRPDRSIIKYEWDFGDGTSYTETAASAPDGLFDGITTHAYSHFDSYGAVLTVTDNNLPAKTDTDSAFVEIALGNRAPLADADGPYNANVGEGVTLDGSGSSDPDEGCGDSIVSYSWDIDEGTYLLTGESPSLSIAQVNVLGVGSHNVVLTVEDIFGITDSDTSTLAIYELDFGDAPDPNYPTRLASNGARHIIVDGFHLGASIDPELDGQPDATATGDDLLDANDDEDGVTFTSSLIGGQNATVTANASATGKLDAWIDYNDNGDWLDAGEQVFTSQPLVAGDNLLTFAVPVNAVRTDQTFARFRFSTGGGLEPTGPADDGEVEDYAVEIIESAEDVAAVLPDPDRPGEEALFVWGSTGNDTVYVARRTNGNVAVTVVETGYNQVFTPSENGHIYVYADGEKAATVGGDDVVVMRSTILRDAIIYGGPGNDTLTGSQGNDLLDGGAGGDKLRGKEGDDDLRGGPGYNYLDGGSGNDRLEGGSGRDRMFGRGGDDLLFGGAGHDKLVGGSGHDILVGGEDDDELQGRGGKDILIGSAGIDTIHGQSGQDILVGGSTDHDANDTALLAILAEWTRVAGVNARIANLENGGGLNGSYILELGDTIHDDGDEDDLFGEAGNDWFLFHALDVAHDYNSGVDRP